MPWHKIVKPEHVCTIANATNVVDSEAQTGSIWKCWVCGQLWKLHRGNFKNKWTAVEEES
jgi:hypothetical protein